MGRALVSPGCSAMSIGQIEKRRAGRETLHSCGGLPWCQHAYADRLAAWTTLVYSPAPPATASQPCLHHLAGTPALPHTCSFADSHCGCHRPQDILHPGPPLRNAWGLARPGLAAPLARQHGKRAYAAPGARLTHAGAAAVENVAPDEVCGAHWLRSGRRGGLSDCATVQLVAGWWQCVCSTALPGAHNFTVRAVQRSTLVSKLLAQRMTWLRAGSISQPLLRALFSPFWVPSCHLPTPCLQLHPARRGHRPDEPAALHGPLAAHHCCRGAAAPILPPGGQAGGVDSMVGWEVRGQWVQWAGMGVAVLRCVQEKSLPGEVL